MGPMDWLKYEIKKAKELDQENRKIRLAIGMKDLTLDQFGHLFGLLILFLLFFSKKIPSDQKEIIRSQFT